MQKDRKRLTAEFRIDILKTELNVNIQTANKAHVRLRIRKYRNTFLEPKNIIEQLATKTKETLYEQIAKNTGQERRHQRMEDEVLNEKQEEKDIIMKAESEEEEDITHLDEIEKNVRENVFYIASLFQMDVSTLVINVQQLRGGAGRFAPAAWTVNEKERDELCVNPDQFCVLVPTEVVDTIMHELVHLYCHRNGIKECSRNGYYHNRHFRETAEQVFKLTCIRAKSSGYNTTSKGNEEYLLGINEKLPHPFDGTWYRNQKLKASSDEEETSTHSFKYACPKCGQSVRGTKKNIRILCLDCRVPYKWIPKKTASGSTPEQDKNE